MSLIRAFVAVLLASSAAFAAPARFTAPSDEAGRAARKPVVGLIVEFRQTAPLQTRLGQLRGDLARLDREPRVERTFSRAIFGATIQVRREHIASIQKLPYVAAVHLEREFKPLEIAQQRDAIATHARAIATSGGAGIKVGVIDTGIDYMHPALGGGFGEGFKVAGGWDFTNNDADPMDDYGHGTHVAGIIAANGSGLTGVAPDVSLIAYKVFNGSGGARESDILAAVERAMDPNGDGDTSDHLDVVNMSLGGPPEVNDPLVSAVERAIAAGVVFCLSNGNGGDYGALPSPALAPSAISVGAIDRENKIASFSTRGPSYDYSIKPEVVAPGVDVVSTLPGEKTGELSGTSMAAPHVAGIAALVRAQHRDWSPAQIKAAIVSSSLALDGDVMIFGAGRASATNAPSIATLPMPSLVNFGQDDTRQNLWTASREVTLRNLTNATQTLRANIAGARDGVTVHVTPDEVTLAAGETKNVRVEINVDNALVPSPVKGSLSYGGRIEWTGGATPLHVPWAFVKAAYLTIENPDGGTAYAAVMGPSGKTIVFDFLDAARVFRPIEKVDVLVAQFEYPPRVAIAEQVSVEANAVASVHLNDAQLTATATTTDEAGNDLASYTRECHEKIVLGFPSGGKVSFESAPDTRALFAPFSSRIRMYLAHTCGDASASTLYAAMHPPIDGLSQSITSTLHPRWLRQDVRFTPELPKSETMISALAMMRFPGTDESFYYDGGSWFLMRGTGSTLKVFFTPSPTPDASFVTMMDWYGKCDVPGLANKADCAFVDNVFFYLDEQHVTAETDLFLEVSPMGYRTPTGEPVTFGRAPVSPQVRFDADKSGYGVVVFWMGPLGERRIGDTADAHVAIYDASGTLLHADYVGFGVDTPLAPGRYRIESVDPDLVAGDVRGTATFTAWLDTSRNDFLIPMFTGLRIVDENERQVSVLDRGAHASLVFSAADQVRGNVIWWERVPPAEEATRVEYRAHGTTEWHPLTATLTARHYPYSVFLNGGVGTMYRADLTSIASSMIGGVDLRVFVEDKAGNSSELRLEPAFVVGESAKRRAVAR